MSAVAARRQSARLRVGDTVTGWSYVEPGDRGREQPQPITGTIAQIGSGWGESTATTHTCGCAFPPAWRPRP